MVGRMHIRDQKWNSVHHMVDMRSHPKFLMMDSSYNPSFIDNESDPSGLREAESTVRSVQATHMVIRIRQEGVWQFRLDAEPGMTLNGITTDTDHYRFGASNGFICFTETTRLNPSAQC
jgi:hypothetical protein